MKEALSDSRSEVRLRRVEPRDVALLFAHQLDAEANRMAGTRARSPEAFEALWARVFEDPSIAARVIVRDALVVGGISCFKQDGLDAVGYWIGREHWGKGIATRALALFLEEVTRRPLHATVACANAASIRVLEKCGFRLTGRRMGEETGRYVRCEIATFILE